MNKRLLVLSIILILVCIWAFSENASYKKTRTSWQEARIHNNLAADYIEGGKYDEAISEANEAIRLYPRYAKAYANLAAAYKEKGLYDDAIKSCRQALKFNHNLFEGHNNLGAALSAKGLYNEAIKAYKKSLRSNARNITAHKNLALAYFEKGLFNEAEKEFDETKRLSVKDIRYLEGSDWNKKINALQEEIKIDPHNARAYYLLAEIYYNVEIYDLAICDLRKSIEVAREYAGNDYDILSAYNYLGASYIQKAMFEEAIRSYKKAIKINPNNHISHYGLGISYWRLGRYNKAISECRQVLKINPHYLIAQYIIGICYEKKRTYRKAIKEFEELLANAPQAQIPSNISYVPLHLAICYKNEGLVDKAKEELNKFQKALRRLDEINNTSSFLWLFSAPGTEHKIKINGKEIKDKDELKKILYEDYPEYLKDSSDKENMAEEMFYLGNICIILDLPDEAIKLLKRAKIEGYHYAKTSFSLGVAYLHNGLLNDAINEFYKAARMEYLYNDLYWILNLLNKEI